LSGFAVIFGESRVTRQFILARQRTKQAEIHNFSEKFTPPLKIFKGTDTNTGPAIRRAPTDVRSTQTNYWRRLMNSYGKISLFVPVSRAVFASALLVAAACISSGANATGVELVALASPANVAPSTAPGALRNPVQSLAAIEVQSGYDAALRGELVTVARYPNNVDARREQLQGKVAVEFEIDRYGVLQTASIVESSRSRILDAAALASIHWAKFQAFPAELAAGEAARRYRATFDYRFEARQ
jgi:TonB family protein